MPKVGDHFYIDGRGVKAEGVLTEKGILVLAGSSVIPEHKPYLSKGIVRMREKCKQDGTIKNDYLTRDVEFKSTSTAAYFLFGANASGPATWRNAEGIPLAQLHKAEKGIIPDTDREYRSFYNIAGGNEGSKCHYPARLDTYGRGCGHDCSYCYAKSALTGHGYWNPLAPSVADPARIETLIKKLPKGSIVRLGGMTDCFQPCELNYRVTLKTIEILNQNEIGYLIVTKSHHVADDEYVNIMRKDLAHIQITVTTFDDERCASYEKASPPTLRVQAIEKLQSLGFDTFFRLSPYIEGFMDFDKLSHVACDKILIEFLRVDPRIKKWFDIDYSDFSLWQDGFLHMPLEKKLAVLEKIKGFKEITVCDFSSTFSCTFVSLSAF